jgi:hypothetical protein
MALFGRDVLVYGLFYGVKRQCLELTGIVYGGLSLRQLTRRIPETWVTLSRLRTGILTAISEPDADCPWPGIRPVELTSPTRRYNQTSKLPKAACPSLTRSKAHSMCSC